MIRNIATPILIKCRSQAVMHSSIHRCRSIYLQPTKIKSREEVEISNRIENGEFAISTKKKLDRGNLELKKPRYNYIQIKHKPIEFTRGAIVEHISKANQALPLI